MRPYKIPREGRGIMVAENLRPGDRYELHDGHPIYCAPTGGDGSGYQGDGYAVLNSDPAVKRAGVDPGYSPKPDMLRAPDVAVGNVPEEPGWIKGVPPLAVEYAGHGQDDAALVEKIDDLLDHGTQFIWVVRLKTPVHVEVHRPGLPVEYVPLDGTLTAPGILQNSVPVRALVDRDVAFEVTLRNLLQRRGYDSIEAVQSQAEAKGKAEGKAEGRMEAARELLQKQLRLKFPGVSESVLSPLANATEEQLDAWAERVLTAATIDEVFKA